MVVLLVGVVLLVAAILVVILSMVVLPVLVVEVGEEAGHRLEGDVARHLE